MPRKRQPIYEADLKAAYCTFELLINGAPSAQQDLSTGNSWHDWPLNGEILQSGQQTVELRILPPKGATTVSPRAQAEMTIYERDATDDDEPRKAVYRMAPITFADKPALPVYAHKRPFRAEVPYTNAGWLGSLDLRKEPEEELTRELRIWNGRLLNIYATAAATGHAGCGHRLAELDKFSKEDADDDARSRFSPGFKTLVARPDEAYRLVFYADGKLAGLKLPYKPPGFVYEPAVPDEDSIVITLTVLFHRRTKGLPRRLSGERVSRVDLASECLPSDVCSQLLSTAGCLPHQSDGSRRRSSFGKCESASCRSFYRWRQR